MTAAPFVVVPCSGAKRPEPELPARERYTGQLHRLAMDAALTLTSEDRVRIMSARYGLLTLDQITEPYDRRVDDLNAEDLRQLKSWVHCDAISMHHQDPDAPVVALVPGPYADVMAWSPLLERKMVRPFDGCGGIGGMRSILCKIRSGAYCP